MSKRRTSHPTREKILQAAIDLMWKHGYRRTSPAQVMEASGVGQGSFYHHFADKRSLGLAVVEEIVRETVTALDDIFRAERAPLDRVRAWIQAAVLRYRPPCDRCCPLGKLGIEMANQDPAFREKIALGFAAIRDRLTESLQEAGAAGQLDPSVHPADLADLLLSGVEGAILIASCDGEAEPMDRSLRILEDLLDRVTRQSLIAHANAADP